MGRGHERSFRSATAFDFASSAKRREDESRCRFPDGGSAAAKLGILWVFFFHHPPHTVIVFERVFVCLFVFHSPESAQVHPNAV